MYSLILKYYIFVFVHNEKFNSGDSFEVPRQHELDPKESNSTRN